MAAGIDPVGHLFSCSSTHRPVQNWTMHFAGQLDPAVRRRHRGVTQSWHDSELASGRASAGNLPR